MSCISITSIEIKPAESPDNNLKAYVSIIVNDCFLVKGLKIINGNKGLFVAMPSRKGKDGQFRDIFHPLNQDTRNSLETMIIDKYKTIVN